MYSWIVTVEAEITIFGGGMVEEGGGRGGTGIGGDGIMRGMVIKGGKGVVEGVKRGGATMVTKMIVGRRGGVRVRRVIGEIMRE